MIAIALIEDIDGIRNNLSRFLSAQPEFSFIASCNSVEDFLEKVPEIPSPNVILCDIGLPGMSGIEGIKKCKQIFPKVEIIMLTVFDDADHIYKALCAGATGYLIKSSPMQKIKDSIIAITKGEVPMNNSIARKLLEHFNPKRTYNLGGGKISTRENQILQLMVDGLSHKMIADRLGISPDTVHTQVKSIYKKLQVNNKAEAILLANKEGLLKK